jgi:hypothetical protein
LTVDAFICSLNPMMIGEVIATLVAPFAGMELLTPGGISSRTVNVDVYAFDIRVPARSLMPLIETATSLLLAKLAVGRNSAP